MMATDDQSGVSIERLIEKGNSYYESTLKISADLLNSFGMTKEARTVTRKLVVYNPQNDMIAKVSKPLSDSSIALCNLIGPYISKIDKRPDDIQSWLVLSKAYLMMNDMPNAYTSVSHVIRINNSVPDSIFWYVAGIVYQHYRYFDESLEAYKLSMDFDPNMPFKSDLLFRKAILLRNTEKYDESISLLHSLMKNPPQSLKEDDIQFLIAFSYQLSGKNDSAQRLYQDLSTKNPNSLQLLQQFSWFLSLQGDRNSWSLAERLVLTAPQEFIDDPVLKLVLARISLKLHDTNTAYQRYKDCLGTWSDSPLFWCGLGVLYLKNEQFSDAIVAFQRALFLKNDIVEAWLNFGLIYHKQGDSKNALRIYETALNNCTSTTLINERINAINNSRSGAPSKPFDIVEIDGSKLFTQVAERISIEFTSSIPLLQSSHLGIGENISYLNQALAVLYIPYTSIFE